MHLIWTIYSNQKRPVGPLGGKVAVGEIRECTVVDLILLRMRRHSAFETSKPGSSRHPETTSRPAANKTTAHGSSSCLHLAHSNLTATHEHVPGHIWNLRGSVARIRSRPARSSASRSMTENMSLAEVTPTRKAHSSLAFWEYCNAGPSSRPLAVRGPSF
jgi:hypothetical protein